MGAVPCRYTALQSMTTQPQSSGPLLPVTIKVSESFLDRMQRLDNGQNRSATIRTCAELGLDWLEDRSNLRAFEAYNLLQRAEALAASWPVGRTPAGSYWAPSPAQMPDQLKPGEVIVRPDGLIARLRGGSFTLDAAEGSLMLVSETGRIWQTTIDRRGLALLVPAWASAMIPLATCQPGEVFPLPLGLSLERLPDGGLVLAGGELQLGLGAAEGFQLAAELASLLAARLRLEGDRVQGLTAALAATPEVQEVAR
jgi:hypothetical protein